MGRLVLNQITIKKERSISSTTWYYLLQPSNASAPDSTNYGNPPPTITTEGYSGWSTAEPTYTIGDNRVLYQMVQTVFSDGSFNYTAPTISSSYEAAKAAYSKALLAEANIEELQDLGLHHGYIWTNQTAKSASGSVPAYPIGSYIASGINNTINQANSNTYGLNTWISTGGINLRYNAIDLAKLTTSTLEFYYPSTTNQGTAAISLGTHGGNNSLIFYEFGSTNKKMELTGSNLNFYGSSQSTPDAQLTSTGLNIANGSIELANGTNDSIKISNSNFTRSINSTSHTNLRMAIGNKFGVASDGTLYASNVDIVGIIKANTGYIGGSSGWTIASQQISSGSFGSNNSMYLATKNLAGTVAGTTLTTNSPSWRLTVGSGFGVDNNGKLYATGAKINGDIVATSLQIGSDSSEYNGIDALNITGYAIEILQNSNHGSVTDPTENTWIYPVLYHNDNIVTVSDGRAFKWYRDSDTENPIIGNQIDGGILGIYGSTYRVTYTFEDGAVVDGASPVQQNITVSDAMHITEISNSGIKVHHSTNNNNYIQIDSTGLEVVQGGTSVAKYGTTARIGVSAGSRFLMNSDSLQAYNSSGTKYFEVTSSGLTWGSNTAATTSQLAEVSQTAAQTATNFIKVDGSGIKIQNSSDATDYLFIDSSKVAIYRDNIEKLQLTDSILRLGDDTNYLFIDSSEITLYKNNIEKLQLTDSLLRLGDSENYVSVDSDSLDIYNNQTRLATFHSEGAEIGENSTTAKIGFNKSRGSITARDLTGSTTGQYDLTFGIDDTGWGNNYYALVTGLKARKVMSNTDESVSRLDVMANNNGASFNMLASHPQYNSSGDNIGSAWPSIAGTTENTGLNGVLNLKVYSTIAGTIEHEGIEIRTNINSTRTSKTTYINFTGNYITFNGTTIHSSDKRLKTHIKYLGKEAIDFISALHPAYFSLKEQKTTGFYAQEVEYIDPWNCFVNEDINGYKTLNYIGLIAPLVTYCQHLEKRITELETQLEGGIN